MEPTKRKKARAFKYAILTLNDNPTTKCAFCGYPAGVTWDTQWNGIVRSFCRGECVEKMYLKEYPSTVD